MLLGYKKSTFIAKGELLKGMNIAFSCRSGNLDVGLEIAKALEMNYTFLCEFLELKSKARSERDQGGGVHGNAILTKFDFSTVEAVRHSHHPIDWETNKHPKTKAEPRKGERMTLCAVLNISQIPLVVYSCHLEVRTSLSVFFQ